MENTEMYWIPVWNIWEKMGIHLSLVNPHLIKQIPGKKSDVKVVQGIATVLNKELLRSILVPCEQIRELQSYMSNCSNGKKSVLHTMERTLEVRDSNHQPCEQPIREEYDEGHPCTHRLNQSRSSPKAG
ncbi:MAG: transposase [Bacteroidales bacterium]|jgi:hypothetical protein|nr:transposase [Bacteroidales bacterium]MDN5329277.1 transposase [Bacteroidales bacterium]